MDLKIIPPVTGKKMFPHWPTYVGGLLGNKVLTMVLAGKWAPKLNNPQYFYPYEALNGKASALGGTNDQMYFLLAF